MEKSSSSSTAPQDDFLFQRSKYIFSFAFDNWYEKLKAFTPASHSIQLSKIAVQALYGLCYGNKLTDDEKAAYEKLSADIDHIIATKFNGEAFVKLSTRSPKDSVAGEENELLRTLWIEEMKKSDGTANGDSVAFTRATRRAFRVTSAAAALELIRKSSRCKEDFMKFVDCDGRLELSVVIREWALMDPAYEFRGIVTKGNLTAISQYCYNQFYKEMVAERDVIQKLLCDFFLEIKPLIPLPNYVIDFAVVTDAKSGKRLVKVIELNPWFADTSACLFHWSRDRPVIDNGPLEMRLVTQPIADPMDGVAECWYEFRKKYRGLVEDERDKLRKERREKAE